MFGPKKMKRKEKKRKRCPPLHGSVPSLFGPGWHPLRASSPSAVQIGLRKGPVALGAPDCGAFGGDWKAAGGLWLGFVLYAVAPRG